MFLWLTLSRTLTTPWVTRVSVVVHVSSVSQVVPRIVAALYRPFVWNAPLPLPHSRRFFFFLTADACALPFEQLSGSVRVITVTGCAPLVCVTLKMPW